MVSISFTPVCFVLPLTISDRFSFFCSVCILSSVISLVGQFAKLYNSMAAFIEIFEPMLLVLKLIPVDELSGVTMVSMVMIFASMLAED